MLTDAELTSIRSSLCDPITNEVASNALILIRTKTLISLLDMVDALTSENARLKANTEELEKIIQSWIETHDDWQRQMTELKALTEWRPIGEAPLGGRPFWINSGPIPGYAMQMNTEEPGCEIEWFYNTHRTSGWTNSLTSIATHWAEIQKGPTPEVTP